MFALLAALFSASAFTDPARRALTPQLVPQHQLHLAATLDAFSWSLMVTLPPSCAFSFLFCYLLFHLHADRPALHICAATLLCGALTRRMSEW